VKDEKSGIADLIFFDKGIVYVRTQIFHNLSHVNDWGRAFNQESGAKMIMYSDS
jgi:hypothetical protein